ncbi:MAG: hypothetical protein ABW360_18360, partial [Phenylobacterium sp.]
MSVAVSVDQLAGPRVEVRHMDRPGGVSFRSMARRVANRAMQGLVTGSMRAAARAEAEGWDALLAYVARQRRIHERFDAPILPTMEAEAIRQIGPGPGLASPPSPSEWFAPRSKAPRGFVFYVHGGSFVAERSP